MHQTFHNIKFNNSIFIHSEDNMIQMSKTLLHNQDLYEFSCNKQVINTNKILKRVYIESLEKIGEPFQTLIHTSGIDSTPT